MIPMDLFNGFPRLNPTCPKSIEISSQTNLCVVQLISFSAAFLEEKKNRWCQGKLSGPKKGKKKTLPFVHWNLFFLTALDNGLGR